MKNRTISTVIYLCIVNPLWANNPTDTTNYWQCVAQDKEGKQWVAKGSYARVASNKAFEACKKTSRVPSSCKAAQDTCDHYDDGMIKNPGWQCTALDRMAKPWSGRTYSSQDEAALAAKKYCQEHSSVPDTCYINLLTCHHLDI